MRKIFLSFLIVLLLFSSCSSDNPSPSGEDVNPPAASDESSLVQKTTEGKFIVESTLQLLSSDIQEAIKSNKPEVVITDRPLANGVQITKGKILINPPAPAARAADSSSYSFSVIIEEAVTSDKESVTLEYESNIQLDAAGSITEIEPVKTEAKIGGASVSDIDSDTFIPVALAFFNADLLNSLSQMMKDIAASEAFSKFGISLEQITIDTNIKSIGKVDVDCAKSTLLSNGTGVLVFKLAERDNQWHTASSVSGVITIDGWADVNGGTIEISENPEVKDENSDISAAEELKIVNSFAPRFYALYSVAYSLIVDTNEPAKPVYEAVDEEQLDPISQAASYFFKNEVTVSSYKIELNDVMMAMMIEDSSEIPSNVSRDDPGIIKVYATMNGYGDVEMIVHVYAPSNNIADNKIISFKVGGKDYSYLANDILKSMLRVFTGVSYSMEGASIILSSVLQTGADFVDNKYTHQFDNTSYPYSHLTYNGSVDINITERNEDDVSGFYSFKEVSVDDSGDVTYVISGNGTFSTARSSDPSASSKIYFDGFTFDSCSIQGIGVASTDDLDVINLIFSNIIEGPKSQTN